MCVLKIIGVVSDAYSVPNLSDWEAFQTLFYFWHFIRKGNSLGREKNEVCSFQSKQIHSYLEIEAIAYPV